jgi:hypothetical protein
MAKLGIPKVNITPEMKQRQLKLRHFLRENKGIVFKELHPIGFSIDVSTIPQGKINEFLCIANSLKNDENEVSRKM